MNIYERVRALADEKNISIAEVERRAGLTERTLVNWRRVKPSGEKLAQVARVFDTSIEYLLGLTENRAFYSRKPAVDLADSSDRVLFNGRELTEKQRSDLNVYIQTMFATNNWI